MSEVRPYSAAQVRIGWRLKLPGGRIGTVIRKASSAPRNEGEDRQIRLWFEEFPEPTWGEAGATVWRIEEEVAP